MRAQFRKAVLTALALCASCAGRAGIDGQLPMATPRTEILCGGAPQQGGDYEQRSGDLRSLLGLTIRRVRIVVAPPGMSTRRALQIVNTAMRSAPSLGTVYAYAPWANFHQANVRATLTLVNGRSIPLELTLFDERAVSACWCDASGMYWWADLTPPHD